MIVAPPMIAHELGAADWRSVFFLTGGLGLAWTLWWHRDYFPPEEHAKLGDAERREIQSVLGTAAGATGELRWLQ